MIYTFVPEQSMFGVNRDFRQIDLTGLNVPVDISIVQWDSNRNTGVIEYKPDAVQGAQIRDLETEAQEYRRAVRNNQDLSKLEPRYKAVAVRKQRRVLQSFDPFLPLLALWEAAAPPPEPAPPPPAKGVPLREVVNLLVQKGVFTAEDVEYLKSTIQE